MKWIKPFRARASASTTVTPSMAIRRSLLMFDATGIIGNPSGFDYPPEGAWPETHLRGSIPQAAWVKPWGVWFHSRACVALTPLPRGG